MALKTNETSVQHKSDSGGVFLGLDTPAQLAAAYAQLSAKFGGAVAISRMVAPGVELSLGIIRDEQFGPLVVVGAGGVLVEILSDRAVAFPDLDLDRAISMLSRLRIRPLLDGVRGNPPVDLAALAGAIVACGSIARELGDCLAAVDINPLICGPNGVRAVDALVVRRTYSNS